MNNIEKLEIKTIKEIIQKPQKEGHHKTFVLDIETGGLNAYTDAICEITLKELGKENFKTWTVAPQRKLYAQSAFNVNGLSLDKIKHGDSLNMILRDLLTRLQGCCTIIGHNVEFDLKFLLQALKEEKLTIPTIHYICTMDMAKKKLLKKTRTNNGQVDNYKLVTLYNYFFNDFIEELAHTSSYDVEMTEKIYNKLK